MGLFSGGGPWQPDTEEDKLAADRQTAQTNANAQVDNGKAGAAAAQNRAAYNMNMGAANQNYAQQNQAGQMQSGLVNQLTAAANGTGGTTIAQQQLHQGQQAAAANAQGQAAGMSGLAGVLAKRGAAQAGASGQQATGVQSNILGAQEQLAARSQLGTALTQERGQDYQAQGAQIAQQSMLAQNQNQQQALNDAMSQAYMGQQEAAMGNDVGLAGQAGAGIIGTAQAQNEEQQNALQQQKNADNQFNMALGAGSGGVSGMMGGMSSDPKLKKNVKREGERIGTVSELAIIQKQLDELRQRLGAR